MLNSATSYYLYLYTMFFYIIFFLALYTQASDNKKKPGKLTLSTSSLLFKTQQIFILCTISSFPLLGFFLVKFLCSVFANIQILLLLLFFFCITNTLGYFFYINFYLQTSHTEESLVNKPKPASYMRSTALTALVVIYVHFTINLVWFLI